MSAFITRIGTAVPAQRLSQEDASRFMLRHLPLDDTGQRQVRALYRASGIRYRHSVIPDYGGEVEDYTFFPKNDKLEPFPAIGRRMELYRQHALGLCLKAVHDGLSAADIQSVTHVIAVSCTGMYAPGLDIELVLSLGLPTHTGRTAIHFMGCYAAFNALKVAQQLVKNDATASVLVVCVELCTLHFQKGVDEDSLLSNALFGDGAAAVLVKARPLPGGVGLRMDSFFSDLAPEGINEMAWFITDFGFQMKLSGQVPEVIRQGIGSLTSRLMAQLPTPVKVRHYAIHPGGKRILQVIEEELGLSPAHNAHAYEVLRRYGNMSSPTVLFVLKEIWEKLGPADQDTSVLSFAFGPGLTLESMLLTIHYEI